MLGTGVLQPSVAIRLLSQLCVMGSAQGVGSVWMCLYGVCVCTVYVCMYVYACMYLYVFMYECISVCVSVCV